jgi:pimeloyl-ACP methyl ester carboxylesterase
MFITLLMAVATGDAQTMRLADSPTAGGDQAYPKLIYYNRLPKGGHFAAWEQPELFVKELRAAFRSLRTAN